MTKDYAKTTTKNVKKMATKKPKDKKPNFLADTIAFTTATAATGALTAYTYFQCR